MSGIAIRVATAAPPRKVISSRCFMTAPNPRIRASYPVTQGRRKGLEAAISTSAMRAACLPTVTGIVKADVRDRRQRAKTRLPHQTEALVKTAVQYYGISAEIRIADGGRSIPIAQIFHGHDIGTGLIYQDINIKVSAVQNSHFDFHKGPASGKHKSYSYRFETPDRVIVFTGDTGASDAVTELAKDADLLVTETSSFEERMKIMIDSGQWQAMTPAERQGITRQATAGPYDLGNHRQDGGTRECQNGRAVTPEPTGRWELHAMGLGSKKVLRRPSARRKRPDGILTGWFTTPIFHKRRSPESQQLKHRLFKVPFRDREIGGCAEPRLHH
jgi:hypothetical protein